MPTQTIRRLIALFALALAAAVVAHGQDVPSPNTSQTIPIVQPVKGKLFVVTTDKPDHFQTCHVRTFTADRLVCSRLLAGDRTYLPAQIVALVLPGDDALRRGLLLGFNVGLGAAIWATVVLAAPCPPCALGTGIAAFFFFGSAGVTLLADGQPNQLLYLAPNQHLSPKLGYVQS